MFLFDVLHLLNEFHVFTSPIKTFISMGVIFILSEVLCWHVAWSVKCICLFQPSRNSIKTLRTSNETTKLWWNRYYIYFVNKNSNESDSIWKANMSRLLLGAPIKFTSKQPNLKFLWTKNFFKSSVLVNSLQVWKIFFCGCVGSGLLQH